MTAINLVHVELMVVLGKTKMPIHQLLRMGHGAVIELNTTEEDDVHIYVDEAHIASGKVVISGSTIAVEVTELVKKPEVRRARQASSDDENPSPDSPDGTPSDAEGSEPMAA